jgi:G protein-coupled glucose receptor regulating Gpa2
MAVLVTNTTYTSPDWAYYQYPASLSPIPDSMQTGLYVLCAFSLLSAVTSLGLLIFITYLFINGRPGNLGVLHKNQYVILIYNLLIADLQLAAGFIVSIKFLYDDQILAPSAACMAQSWFTNVGDLASGLFVLAIAAYTFLVVVFGRILEFVAFYSVVIALWVISIVLTAVPVILHPTDIFVVSGNRVSSSSLDRLRASADRWTIHAVLNQCKIRCTPSLFSLRLDLPGRVPCSRVVCRYFHRPPTAHWWYTKNSQQKGQRH